MDQQRSQNGGSVFPARSFSANAYRIHRSKVTSEKISRMRKKRLPFSVSLCSSFRRWRDLAPAGISSWLNADNANRAD